MKAQPYFNQYTPPKSGLILLQCMILVLFCLFSLRFWFLQIHQGKFFAQRSRDNTLRYEHPYSIRGLIYDSNGRILADNHPSFAIALNRDKCNDLNATLAHISEWSGIDLNQITKKYQQDILRGTPFDKIILCSGLTFSQVAHISGQLIYWPEIEIIVRNQRCYPYKNAFAHILGYVAEANSRELKCNSELSLGDSIGKLGLEKTFEQNLRGKKGCVSLNINVLGQILDKNLITNPKNGENIHLTIDASLQQSIYNILGDKTGSVVVLNPHTGAIRAIVTTPAYDNNLFINGRCSVKISQRLH